MAEWRSFPLAIECPLCSTSISTVLEMRTVEHKTDSIVVDLITDEVTDMLRDHLSEHTREELEAGLADG